MQKHRCSEGSTHWNTDSHWNMSFHSCSPSRGGHRAKLEAEGGCLKRSEGSSMCVADDAALKAFCQILWTFIEIFLWLILLSKMKKCWDCRGARNSGNLCFHKSHRTYSLFVGWSLMSNEACFSIYLLLVTGFHSMESYQLHAFLFSNGVTFHKLEPRGNFFFNWGVPIEQPQLRLHCATSAWNGLKIAPVIHQRLFVKCILIFPATFEAYWSCSSSEFWSLLPHTQTPCWAHLQAQPLTHTHMPPQPPLLESSVLLNCTAHSLLECICTPSNTSDPHICTAALTGERWEKRMWVSSQTQRTSWWVLTRLHCTQLLVFDYWWL